MCVSFFPLYILIYIIIKRNIVCTNLETFFNSKLVTAFFFLWVLKLIVVRNLVASGFSIGPRLGFMIGSPFMEANH